MATGGLMKQRDPGQVAARLRVVGGRLTADQLEAIAAACRRHGDGTVHLTVRQSVEIPHVPREAGDAVAADLAAAGLELGACGARVRGVPACPATGCAHGVVDAQALAQALDERFFGRDGLPHKFKLAVTGCPNGCAKPHENDVGVGGARPTAFHPEDCTACGACVDACPIPGLLALEDGALRVRTDPRPGCEGQPDGCIQCGDCVAACPTGAWEDTGPAFAVFVGGRMGRRPRLGERLPFVLRRGAEVVALVDRALAWYAREGRPRERFGDTIERLGLPALLAWLRPAGAGAEPAGAR